MVNAEIKCLYKFMKSEHLDSFLTGECVRIGTLHEYTNPEQYELGTYDADEGAININDSSGVMVLNENTNPDLIHKLQKSGFPIGIYMGIKIHSPYGTHIRIASPNCHIFCTSEACEPEISADLNSGYDVCVKIGNPIAFHHRILEAFALYSPVSQDGVTNSSCLQVKYVARNLDENADNYEFGPHIKDTHFELQKECRIIFDKKISDVEPLFLRFDPSGCDLSVYWRKGD